MAQTPVASNNKAVVYRGRPEREMAGEIPDNRKNAEHQPVDGPVHKARKVSSPQLRKSAKHAIKRGMISEKAAKKHLGAY